jgi:hypothetical protein
MNNNYMLLMMLALGSSSSSNGGKGGSSDFLDAMLISSNMMPEMMRLMFAMMSIQKRNDRTNTLATETAAAMKILGGDLGTTARKLTRAELDARPELKALLDRVSSTDKDAVVGATSVVVEDSAPATRVLARGKGKQA